VVQYFLLGQDKIKLNIFGRQPTVHATLAPSNPTGTKIIPKDKTSLTRTTGIMVKIYLDFLLNNDR
jgi:hypothetical protein